MIDNMHPYLTMPSRAAQAGPGGFSYYDHVYLPENEKDLIWAHGGLSYRSQVVVRLNGRRRTEAFLFELAGDGAWKPVVLDDGTVADGKVDGYARCVEAICGSADTFFTSVFAAQGKRQLSGYRNAEIKTLLADLLGQEEIQALGRKAAETARLLRAAFAAIRQEQAGLADETRRVDEERRRLAGAGERVRLGMTARQVAQGALEECRTRCARLSAEADQSRATEARRTQLQGECRSVIRAGKQAIEALKAQEQTEAQRLTRLEQRIAQRHAQARNRRQVLEHQRRQCLAVLDAEAVVTRAARLRTLAEYVAGQRLARVDGARQRVAQLTQVQAAERAAALKLVAIEREAGQAALKADELARRFGLTEEVPCAGTDLQGCCKLLGDAREAQALLPSAQGAIRRFARDRMVAQQEREASQRQLVSLADAPTALLQAERRAKGARERASRLALLAAQAGEMHRTRAALAELERELAAIGPRDADGQAPAETADELAERQQVEAGRRAIACQREQQAKHYRATLDRLEQALLALPPPFDDQALAQAQSAMASAAQVLAAAEQAHLRAVQDAEALSALGRQADALTGRQAQVAGRMARIETELGAWNLFAKCMSNDGLIALAIDDAGPALSGLSNDLLLACYGPRFTVSIQTLVETAKGDQKEGFDIIVYDGETGESKSIGLMSGGEKTFIEACLTRAIALYLARHTGRGYSTIFTDEADGALDSQRKRMFMAMKREVLRLGGYEREFFVSQTPELVELADAVIDLTAMSAPGV
ncbi:DNA repair protein [Cupriavidus basilensis]|uniref:DNA repair protein n=1 Tax=Cupriavidus basilensis TaxID=68895 RepID=A0ABT6AGK4_9BURK|nr:DNA repair protein [Cupriavidus basilensis]MDF3831462.1 DNA repair protein [Cupriavidus basilensis]